jgi:hypothetical protein
MTMHMEGPWLSTTGKRKGKAKYRNAESAQRARELSASWSKLKQEWGATEQESKRNRALKAPAMSSYSLSYPPGREPKQHIPSKDTGVGIAARAEDKVYTGSAVIGVATMHKSNAVPVFSTEDAVEIARMRRG